MFIREKQFNEKLLALREKKTRISKTIATLHREYYQIHDLLGISAERPVNITVQTDPKEFPET